MMQMTLEWLAIKFILFCAALFYVLWKRYLTKKNILPILLIIFISGIIAYRPFKYLVFEFIAAIFFILLRKRQRLPLRSKDSLWLFLFIISSESLTFLLITFWNIAASGDY